MLDATAQADLVRRGEVTTAELLEEAIARIERLNPSLNAIIPPLLEGAREATPADGPFRGVPIVMKDLVSTTAGDPYHCGMRLLRDLNWIEPEDSPTAAKLRAAGFVFVGRTNVPELGLMPTTEPVAYGPTRNPWNLDHSTGGSSGGSAAAVASGMVSIAHATDGGGSIRIPASECGLVGLKPSRGRVARPGDAADILGVEHVLSRSVRDSAALLDVLGEPIPGERRRSATYAQECGADPGHLRVGLMVRAPGGAFPVHDDCVRAAKTCARLLESLGHEVEESHPPALDELEYFIQFGAVTGCDVASLLDMWSGKTGHAITSDDVEPNTWMIAEMGRAISDEQLNATKEWLQGYARRVTSWWGDGFDLLLTPTLPEPPPKLGDLTAASDNPLAGAIRGGVIAAFTPHFNTTGQPAISLPLPWNETGLPVGVQLVAAYGREDVLIRVAAQLEAARPWIDRLPPVFA